MKGIREALLELKPRKISKSLPREIEHIIGWYPSRSSIYVAMAKLRDEELVELYSCGKNSVWLWKKQDNQL